MIIKQNCKIILASSSKIRQKILQDCGLNFDVVKPFYDEDSEKKNLTHFSPSELAIFLAKQKALSVSNVMLNAYIIGSDQVCEFQKTAISKSHNQEEAFLQLKKFNGKIHYQNNAVAIAFNGKIIFENFSRAKMKMRKMTAKEIENYVLHERPWGCAGSYQYESFGKHLFAEVSGDYFSILGIALQPLLSFFHSQKLIEI